MTGTKIGFCACVVVGRALIYLWKGCGIFRECKRNVDVWVRFALYYGFMLGAKSAIALAGC